MRIIRAPQQSDFVQVPNSAARDRRLSFRARGVLLTLLSHVDGWETDSTELAAQAKEGRDAVRTALDELERYGYLLREKTQDADSGRWSTAWTVRCTPEPTTDSQAPVPETESQASGTQSSETRASDSQAPIGEDQAEDHPPTPQTAPPPAWQVEEGIDDATAAEMLRLADADPETTSGAGRLAKVPSYRKKIHARAVKLLAPKPTCPECGQPRGAHGVCACAETGPRSAPTPDYRAARGQKPIDVVTVTATPQVEPPTERATA